MPRYFINGKTYNIPDEKVQDFLSKNQGATEIEPIADFKTETEKYAKQVKKRLEAGYFDPTGQTEVYARERTEELQKQLQNTQAAQTIEQANDLSGLSLSDPTQGSFGEMFGSAEYFIPEALKPEMPELKIEEYIKKDYKIDSNEEEDKFNEKYLKPLLDDKQWETWKLFTEIQRTTEITDEQEKEIQDEANLLFPTSKDGTTSTGNLNPENLVTQEQLDQLGDKTADVMAQTQLGGGLLKDERSAFYGWAIEKFARWFGDGDLGDKKLLGEKEQQQITTQLKFIEQAEQQMQAALKQGKITEEEANNKNAIADLAKRLYVHDEKYGITGVLQNNVITKMRDDYSGFGKISKSDLQKQLDEVYTVVESGLNDISKKSLGVTKSASARITAIDKELELLQKKEPKSAEELSALYLDIENLIKERNQQQAMGEYNAGVQEFIVGGMEDVERFGDMMGKNFNGITNFAGKFSVAAAEIVFNASEMVDRFTNPRTVFSEFILPIAKSNLPDSMNHIAVAAHALESIDKTLYKAKGIDLLGRKTKAKAWKGFDDWGEGMRDSLAPPQSFGDIKNASDVGNWILDFSASQMPQLVLMYAAGPASLPLLTASAGGSKFREMQKEMDAGYANYTPFQMYGAASMTAAAEYFSEKITLGQLQRLKIQNIPVKGVKQSFLEGLRKNILNPKKIGAYLYDVNEEGITEMVATMGENFASKYIQGKEDVNLWDNIGEAYVGGVFMSGLLFRAPGVAGQMLAPFQTNRTQVQFNDNAFQIKELSQELGKNIDQKTRDVITNKINDLVKANVELKVNNSLAVDLLNQDQKNDLVSIHQQQVTNNNAITQLEQDKNLDPKIAKQQIQQLKSENGKLQKQRDDIMQPVIDKRLEMGIEFAETQAKELAGLEGSKLSGNVISDLSQQEITDKYGEEAGESGGFFDPDTGDIVINKEVAAKLELVTVSSHELFHGILKTEMIKSPELAKVFSKNFKNILSTSELDVLNKRLEAVDENGERIYSEEYLEKNPDEILTQFSDAILAGEIKFKESLFDKIRKLITPLLKKAGFPKIEFNNAQETYDFIKDYTKFVKQNTLEGDADLDTSPTGEFVVQSDSTTGEGRDYIQKPKKDEEDGKADMLKRTQAFSKSVKKGNINTLATDMAKKGYDNLTQSQQNSLKKQYTSVALAAIKFDVGKGTINAQDAQSFVDSQFTTIARNYRPRNPKTNKKQDFTTYIYNTVGRRGADLYGKQEGLAEAGQTTSLDDARAQQVADTTSETTVKPEVKPTIDVMSFAKQIDSSVDTKAFEADFTDAMLKNAKDKGIDLSDPNLTTTQLQSITPYNVLAKALGIPVNKISNPKDNLGKEESLKVQRALLKARSFVKNVVLSKANKDVQEVASKKKGGKPVKIGGETLKLGRNILNTFFNPPKRVGNNNVRTPKKFDNKVYEQSIGVKDGKVDPNYKPRDAESQVMKGFIKAIAEQMTNRSIARSPDATPEVKANLDRGKSSRVFSRKNTNKKLLEKHPDAIVLDNKNLDHVKIFEDVWSNDAPKYLPVHGTGGIFTASSFANSGKVEAARLAGYQFFTSSKLAEVKRKAKKNEGKFTKEQRKNVQIAGSSKDGYWKKMGQASYLDTIKQNYDGFKFVLFGLKKMYDNAKGNVTITLNGKQQKISKKALVASVIGAWMNNVSDSNKHFLRNAAIPKMLDPAFLKANGMPNFEISIAEHNVMANDMVDKAYRDGILDGKMDTVFEFLVDNYFQSLIAKTDDGKLSVEGSHNFDDSTPPEVQKAYEEF
jgi:hypothetical protein